MRLPDPPLLVITDRHAVERPIEEIAEQAFLAGCRWLSLRDKDLPAEERASLLARLLELGETFGATVTSHGDRPAATSPHGLHLSRRGDVAAARQALGAGALIGFSAHDAAEADAAARGGADYVTFSPVFPSLSKRGHGDGQGLMALGELAGTLALPVVALGGVTPDNARPCVEAGAAGLAVVGAVMAAVDPGEVVRDLLHVLAETAR